VDPSRITRSIELISASRIAHEFRTTVVRSQLALNDLITVAQLIRNAPLYVLQPFVASKMLDERLRAEKSYTQEEILAIREKLEKIVFHCEFR
jgi:pyruvate formate lyase activating enzyme